MTKYILNLSDKSNKYKNVAGGKGSALNKLILSGSFNVPNGIVVKPNAFNCFLSRTFPNNQLHKQLDKLDYSNSSINKCSKILKSSIISSNFPLVILEQLELEISVLESQTFAVRSSAAFEDSKEFSWAGQFDSFLNIPKSKITESILKCWSSTFNPRAMKYNPNVYKNLKNIKFAVIVQEMIDADYSGVMFSRSPENGKNFARIEATSGLGDKLVSGRQIPFAIEIDKRDQLFSNYLNNDYLLTDLMPPSNIKKIYDAGIKVEKLFKFPVDVEWALKDGKLYILQSRAITKYKKNE